MKKNMKKDYPTNRFCKYCGGMVHATSKAWKEHLKIEKEAMKQIRKGA